MLVSELEVLLQRNWGDIIRGVVSSIELDDTKLVFGETVDDIQINGLNEEEKEEILFFIRKLDLQENMQKVRNEMVDWA